MHIRERTLIKIRLAGGRNDISPYCEYILPTDIFGIESEIAAESFYVMPFAWIIFSFFEYGNKVC